MDELRMLLSECLNEGLYQMTAGGPRKKEEDSRIKVRPVLIKNELVFQVERFRGNQVFHENLSAEDTVDVITAAMEQFRQLDVETQQITATVLVSKKGKMTVRRKQKAAAEVKAGRRPDGAEKIRDISHNRQKRYILEEGRAVPFLIDLGVQTADGKIVKSRYDKFRQINRFLEFIADIMPILPKDRTVRIIDFGCGKSYLTFAMYYYLHELAGLDIRVTGLDLKTEVIRNCSNLAGKYGYSGLEFLQGDIADYTGADEVDMVVTLHACDTATDLALHKAVKWGASVILSVPCCQHELNRQIRCEELQPALKYGLSRERMSALLTDAVRANLLEEQGYDAQILEFIDMEHTPKNILIRAVKKKNGKKINTGVGEMTGFLNADLCLQRLLGDGKDK